MILRQVNVEISTHQYRYARLLLEKNAPTIQKHGTDLLRGKLYFHYALVLEELTKEENNSEYLGDAIENYKKASRYYEKAGHNLYHANVENNLGFLLCNSGNYKQSHQHLNRALDFYIGFGDKSHAASTLDCKARAFLGEGNLNEAEKAARFSVQLIHEGDEKSKLTESLTTLGTVLARRNKTLESKKCFEEAANSVLAVGDNEDAGTALLTLVEELRENLSFEDRRNFYLRAEEILRKTSRTSTLERLQNAGKEFSKPEEKSLFASKEEKWKGFSLPTEVKKYEAKFVFEALQDANGKVTKAAEFLGISHQTLSLLLKQRHKSLASIKKPRKPRTVRPKVK